MLKLVLEIKSRAKALDLISSTNLNKTTGSNYYVATSNMLSNVGWVTEPMFARRYFIISDDSSKLYMSVNEREILNFLYFHNHDSKCHGLFT